MPRRPSLEHRAPGPAASSCRRVTLRLHHVPRRTPPSSISLATLRRYQAADHDAWAFGGTAIAAFGYTAVAVLAWATEVPRDPAHAWLLTAAAAACWFGLLMVRTGRSFGGAAIACAALWLEVHASLAMARQFPSAGLIAAPVLGIAASLLFGSRVALGSTLLSVAITTPLYLVSPALRETGLQGEQVFWLGVHAAVSLAVWGLMRVSLHAMHRLVRTVEQREQDFAMLAQQAPDGLLRISHDGIVRASNQSARALLGLRPSAVAGAPSLRDLLVRARVDDAPAAAEQAKCPDGPASDSSPLRWRLPGPDGTRTLEVLRRTMPSGDWLLSLRDVTAQLEAVHEELEAAARRAHAQRLESLGQFAGGIAHDFNNLLHAFGGLLQLTRAERDPGVRAKLLGELEATQARGAALTRQLLAFARRDDVHPTVLDLSELVQRSLQLLGRVADDAVTLRAEVGPPAWVRADATHLEQVLVNLVANARDAMPDGGTCTVTVTATDDAVRLVVEDTGQGMDEATRARAVEPFFTTKPRARGTGLGLATVHGIIEQAGGLLTIDSTPGKGTRVTIELPAAPAPAVQHERAPEAPPSALAPRAPLLVADDDDTVRHTIARLLRRAGFTVHAVADGREALAALEERPGHFGLVLTDVMMPGMGGKVLAAEIRARWPDLPVLFMTGYIQQRFDDIPDFEPARDLITKPFSVDALVARVAERLQDRASVG